MDRFGVGDRTGRLQPRLGRRVPRRSCRGVLQRPSGLCRARQQRSLEPVLPGASDPRIPERPRRIRLAQIRMRRLRPGSERAGQLRRLQRLQAVPSGRNRQRQQLRLLHSGRVAGQQRLDRQPAGQQGQRGLFERVRQDRHHRGLGLRGRRRLELLLPHRRLRGIPDHDLRWRQRSRRRMASADRAGPHDLDPRVRRAEPAVELIR